ncbi:MAG: ATP-dependent Clp protease ATP-binding subunit [Pseudonocardia sp.]|nr:ATP-dependent Clp protease ATP-binding subunit [Pseudonocardia sp.]
MSEPYVMQRPVRLDDLIHAVRATDDDPLRRLSNAVLAAEHLGDLADHLVGHFVDIARRSGASWTAIGSSMGVTKQAAQQRFTPKPDADKGFHRFTVDARNAVMRAQEAARTAGNGEIVPAHLVLGVLATVPDAAGRPAADLRRAVTATLPARADAPPDVVPFDAAARKTIELTFREALRTGHELIEPGHLLLAVLDAEKASGPLTAAGVTRESIEAALPDSR